MSAWSKILELCLQNFNCFLFACPERKKISFSHQIRNKDLISFVCLAHFTSENWLCFQARIYYFRWFWKFCEKTAKIYKDFVTSINNGNFDRIDRQVGRCSSSDIGVTVFPVWLFLFFFLSARVVIPIICGRTEEGSCYSFFWFYKQPT